jgi:hypothetical protein
VVLRVELRDGSDIEDLLTDLRLLGLRPNLLSEQTV